MLIMIIQAGMVAASSWLFTRKYFKAIPVSGLILTWFILFFSQIVLVELLWGIIGRLYLWNILLTQAVIFMLAILTCYEINIFCFPKPDLDFFINNKVLLLAFSVFLPFFLVKLYVNLINPPVSPGSFQQHLAFPATWIVSGNLNNPFHIFQSMPFLRPGSIETSSASYYPVNAQLFYTWLMMPLRNAFLADAGEAPFYLIGIIAIFAILRKYGVDRALALLTGFLWALIPNIFKQLRVGSEIDVICAVLFLLIFYTILRLKDDFSFKNSLLFGIAVGVLVGTKIINLVWLAAFMPFICYALFKAIRAGKFTLPGILSRLATVISMIILFGGFIYIKNYIFTGNPLFPINLKIMGHTILKGLIDNTSYKDLVACELGLDFNRIFFKEGLGVQFLTLIFPAIFIPLALCGFLRNKFKPFAEYLLLFATPILMLVLYSKAINIFTMRYFFPFLSLGIIVAVIFTTKSMRSSFARLYLYAVAVISILTSEFKLANGYELAVAASLALIFLIILLIFNKQIGVFYKSKAFGKTILWLLVILLPVFVYLNHKYDREEFARHPLVFSKKEAWQRDLGRGWQALNELTGKGGRVAHTGRQEFYPLYGAGLKNYVTYVSVNAKEAAPYNHPDGMPRKIKDFNAWRDNLKNQRIGYLFIALPTKDNRESEDPAKFPIEDEWALSHPGEFKLLFANSLSRIYKVSLND